MHHVRRQTAERGLALSVTAVAPAGQSRCAHRPTGFGFGRATLVPRQALSNSLPTAFLSTVLFL